MTFLSVSQVAAMAGMSRPRIQQLVHSGVIPSTREPLSPRFRGGFRYLIALDAAQRVHRYQRPKREKPQRVRQGSGPPTDATIMRLWQVMGELGIGSIDAVLEAFR